MILNLHDTNDINMVGNDRAGTWNYMTLEVVVKNTGQMSLVPISNRMDDILTKVDSSGVNNSVFVGKFVRQKQIVDQWSVGNDEYYSLGGLYKTIAYGV
jgi:hypothetical protein